MKENNEIADKVDIVRVAHYVKEMFIDSGKVKVGGSKYGDTEAHCVEEPAFFQHYLHRWENHLLHMCEGKPLPPKVSPTS